MYYTVEAAGGAINFDASTTSSAAESADHVAKNLRDLPVASVRILFGSQEAHHNRGVSDAFCSILLEMLPM